MCHTNLPAKLKMHFRLTLQSSQSSNWQPRGKCNVQCYTDLPLGFHLTFFGVHISLTYQLTPLPGSFYNKAVYPCSIYIMKIPLSFTEYTVETAIKEQERLVCVLHGFQMASTCPFYIAD